MKTFLIFTRSALILITEKKLKLFTTDSMKRVKGVLKIHSSLLIIFLIFFKISKKIKKILKKSFWN